MRLKFVMEYDDKLTRVRHVHLLVTPTLGEPGYYRSTVSAGAFFNYSPKRMGSRYQGGSRYLSFLKSMDQYSSYVDLSVIPTSFHASIWDFYKAIGYDYKKKKFTTVETK